jgi:ribosomal protein S19E (S16A)
MDDAGDLVFPSVPAVPGIYRFTIKDGSGIVAEYIGQAAVSLVQRFGGYRSRGRKPALPLEKKTTSRNARKILDALRAGRVVGVAIVDDRAVTPDGQVIVVDLADKALRDELEKILIERLRGTGVEVLNR